MDDPLVAESGEVADAPGEDDLYFCTMNMGDAGRGCYLEWQNLRDGWIMAGDDESFVDLDNNL